MEADVNSGMLPHTLLDPLFYDRPAVHLLLTTLFPIAGTPTLRRPSQRIHRRR